MAHTPEAHALALMDQGRAHLDAGRRPQAEQAFRSAAKISPTPHALNNWALCRYLTGDHPGALRILAPLLGDPAPLPFTRALASLAEQAQGHREAAGDLLHRAVRDFEAGVREAGERGGVPEPAWVEYTILIKQAAGELGDHRLVLDLHRRWPGRDLPQGGFAAGVAAFNLGRFDQAAKYWRRIIHPEWRRPVAAYARVADLVAQGVVPPFDLEYTPATTAEERDDGPTARKGSAPEQGTAAGRDGATGSALAARGTVRIQLLAFLFDEAVQDAGAVAQSLMAASGAWGVELGRRFLAGSSVPMPLKLAAAKVLTEAGLFAPGDRSPSSTRGAPPASSSRKWKYGLRIRSWTRLWPRPSGCGMPAGRMKPTSC